MKKEEREIYKLLIELPRDGYGLCNICRYSEWTGDCDTSDLYCHCGIWVVEDNAYDVWGSKDCWAFRPRWLLEDIVDMVGIWLRGENPDMSNCKDRIPKKLREL